MFIIKYELLCSDNFALRYPKILCNTNGTFTTSKEYRYNVIIVPAFNLIFANRNQIHYYCD